MTHGGQRNLAKNSLNLTQNISAKMKKKEEGMKFVSVDTLTSEADTHCILHLEQKVSKCRPVNCFFFCQF